MRIKIFTLMLFASLLKPNNAVAETNAMDGSFRYSIEFKVPGRTFTITYNSRSLHEGVFGLGWCASFEKTAIYRFNSYWLLDCNLPEPQKISAQEAQKYMAKLPPLIPPQIKYQVQNARLIQIQGGSTHLKFQYDKSSNLAIIHDPTRQQVEMIRYDEQDRVISHHHKNLCFDQFQYLKEAQNLYTTEVSRSCPYLPKEKLKYVFSVKTHRKQRQISSVEVSRHSDEKSKKKTERLSTLP